MEQLPASVTVHSNVHNKLDLRRVYQMGINQQLKIVPQKNSVSCCLFDKNWAEASFWTELDETHMFSFQTQKE